MHMHPHVMTGKSQWLACLLLLAACLLDAAEHAPTPNDADTLRSNRIISPVAMTGEMVTIPMGWGHMVCELSSLASAGISQDRSFDVIRIGKAWHDLRPHEGRGAFVWLRSLLDEWATEAQRHEEPHTGTATPQVIVELRADYGTEYRLIREVLHVLAGRVDPATMTLLPADASAKQHPPFVHLLFTTRRENSLIHERAIPVWNPAVRTAADHHPEAIVIRLWPSGIDLQADPADMQAQWQRLRRNGEAGSQVFLQIADAEPLLINGRRLEKMALEAEPIQEMNRIGLYLIENLHTLEVDGPRRQQRPIHLRCFGGLPWQYPLSVFDFLRFFEGLQIGTVPESEADSPDLNRFIELFPSPDPATYDPGQELFDLINGR